MNPFPLILAGVALVLPPLTGVPGDVGAPRSALPDLQDTQAQVRVQQTIVIRISPPAPDERARALEQVPRRPMDARYEERAYRGCVRLDHIVGSQPLAGNRLLLFMRDRNVLTVALDRQCSAENFYSGFYVEKNGDGMLCAGRDTIRARNGATCEIAGLNRLVAIRE